MKLLYFFVSAPAWQIVSIMILPLILAMSTSSVIESMFIIQIAMFVAIFTMLLWIYSVCILINKKYSSKLNVPLLRLKMCITYNMIYSIFFSFGIIPIDYLTPFHLLFFICNVYALYFLSKLLVMVEKKGKVNFKDWIGTFIAAYFFIFGIWTIQPRIIRMFSSNNL